MNANNIRIVLFFRKRLTRLVGYVGPQMLVTFTRNVMNTILFGEVRYSFQNIQPFARWVNYLRP